MLTFPESGDKAGTNTKIKSSLASTSDYKISVCKESSASPSLFQWYFTLVVYSTIATYIFSFNKWIIVLSQALIFNETWKIFIPQPCINCSCITTWNLQRNPYVASIYFLAHAIWIIRNFSERSCSEVGPYGGSDRSWHTRAFPEVGNTWAACGRHWGDLHVARRSTPLHPHAFQSAQSSLAASLPTLLEQRDCKASAGQQSPSYRKRRSVLWPPEEPQHAWAMGPDAIRPRVLKELADVKL